MEGFPKSPETEDSVVLRDNVRERESSPEGPWGFSVGCRRYSTSTVVLVVFLRAAHKRLPKNIKPDSASSHTLPHTCIQLIYHKSFRSFDFDVTYFAFSNTQSLNI